MTYLRVYRGLQWRSGQADVADQHRSTRDQREPLEAASLDLVALDLKALVEEQGVVHP